METIDANDPRIASFLSAYREKSVNNPSLYAPPSYPDSVHVPLPADLKGYSNAASGNSGPSGGYVPWGIRVQVDNPKEFIATIFSTNENMAAFLNSSSCDGVSVADEARREFEASGGTTKPKRKRKVVIKVQPPSEVAAANAMSDYFGRPAVVTLAKSLGGAAALQAAVAGKTVQDVADEYGLAFIVEV